jgi:hypothetical protein
MLSFPRSLIKPTREVQLAQCHPRYERPAVARLYDTRAGRFTARVVRRLRPISVKGHRVKLGADVPETSQFIELKLSI